MENFEYTKFSYATLLILIVLCLTVGIIFAVNASNYSQVLNDTNDENIGDNRGSVIWYYWLNIILSIVSFLLFIYFFFRLFSRKNVYQLASESKLAKALSSESAIDVLRASNKIKECNDIGLEPNLCDEYHSSGMSKYKVEFYLEKERFIDDNVIFGSPSQNIDNIRESIYNVNCKGKNAKDCIIDTIIPKYNDELYVDALPKVYSASSEDAYLNKAKTQSESLIEQTDDIKTLNGKIEQETDDAKKSNLTSKKQNIIKRKLKWSK